jgi:RES domain-containing protein
MGRSFSLGDGSPSASLVQCTAWFPFSCQERLVISKRQRPRTLDEWAERLQPEVAYCYNCQPRDDGEFIWVVGDQIDMSDFLSEHEVPEKLWDAVAEKLRCDNCGTELDLSCEIGRKSNAEKAADEQWRQWHREYAPRLEGFVRWLEKHPYLGADHPLGRDFLAQIKEFPTVTYARKEWWRARRVEGPTAFTTEEMGPPPLPPKSEGRYNHHGQRVFYLASDKENAAAEALGEGESLVWVQQFEILDRTKLLDLRVPFSHEDMGAIPLLLAGLAWSRAHMTSDDPKSEWKPQYFLPRFIADCARRHGFRGIVFDSPKHYGQNLVLFKWKAKAVQAVGNPRLLEWKPPKESESPF